MRQANVYMRRVPVGELNSICLPCDARPAEGIAVYTVTGKAADSSKVYLQPVTQMKAGHAYLFRSKQRQATFHCDEATVMSPVSGLPLQGTFHHNPSLVKGSYVLYDSAWHPAGDRLSIHAYCATLCLAALPDGSEGEPMQVSQESLL